MISSLTKPIPAAINERMIDSDVTNVASAIKLIKFDNTITGLP